MEALIEEQTDLHRRIARTLTNFKKAGAAKTTLGHVQAALDVLETRWGKFEANHEELCRGHKRELSKLSYLTNDLEGEVQAEYINQKAMLLETQRSLKGEAGTGALVTARPESSSQRTPLPRLELPSFSGKYEDWPSFRDLFDSIVGQDPHLSDVQRLHYLKTKVRGAAEQLLRGLPSTEANYQRAWTTLTAHYDRKRLLVKAYLSALTSLPRMKPGCVADLRKIYHGMVSSTQALEGIGQPISNSANLLVHLMVELLDAGTRKEWENSLARKVDPPSYEELRAFLEDQMMTHEALRGGKGDPSTGKSAHHAGKRGSFRGCAACEQDHFIAGCENFRQCPVKERLELVEAKRLCSNCLGRHQVSACASQKTCRKCSSRHHTLLHDAFGAAAGAAGSVAVGTASPAIGHAAGRPSVECASVLLATARVLVTDRLGAQHAARALVDPGSETSLIAESLAQRLRLARTPTSVAIFGVGGAQTGVSRGRVALTLASRDAATSFRVDALVLPRLSAYSGAVESSAPTWSHVRDLQLADPAYCSADPVELLLGADAYTDIVRPGLRRGGPSEPIAQRTALGWIILGPVGACPAAAAVSSYQCGTGDDLVPLLRRFWEQEEPPRSPLPMTPEDEACESHFQSNHSQDATGRYTVRLATRSELPNLSSTRRAAKHLLTANERRFQRDPVFRALYEGFLTEYEELGHMTAAAALPADAPRACYLPHHGVLRGSGPAVRIRVVFNGSSRAASGTSLNDELLVGPNLLPALCDVVLRWRRHRFVLTADVEKMYRQIWVHPEDRNLQRIYWRVDGHVREFQLNTVTYGLASAPYLAIRTLRQLAEDDGARYPQGAEALRRDTYMDDVLSGAASPQGARALREQLTQLCRAGGFTLRKWAANCGVVLEEVPAEQRHPQPSTAALPSEERDILGIRWHPETDCFSPSVRAVAEGPATKRSVLAQTARLFDPLGWLAPVVVRAKLLVQTAWLRGLDWDTPLAKGDAAAWRQLQQELAILEDVRIPRWIRTDAPSVVIEIHGFADASERAYGAVVYLRTSVAGDVHLSLLLAKTRVAPLKQVSLPRLELCAAALLARIVGHTQTTLTLTRSAKVHLWSDSTVVLGWLRGHPTRWTTFVANRVAEIQGALPDAHWHHVPGQVNPADCASRGASPGELRAHDLWWRGPEFLWTTSASWPTEPGEIGEDGLPEERRARVHVVDQEPEPDELTRFSSLRRLLHITAWMRRWLAHVRPQPGFISGQTLTSEELVQARDVWIRRIQLIAFRREVKLAAEGPVERGPLRRLSPFVDAAGLLRVGGRLRHALLSPEQRHPIILPPTSHFAGLVVAAEHARTLHGGTQLTLASIRRQYWLPRGRQIVRRFIYRCLPCLRWRAASPQPTMGNLPGARVTPSRPFTHTGVDYAGPMLLRTSRGRGHKAYKAFVAVFVCFSSRAVHLEVASDYSSDAFLAAFRRFTSRRGLCQVVYSDCGTNFVGADRQLQALFKASTEEFQKIVGRLADEGIRWKFNPPAAPHFGGLWEAAVKAVKHHLRRVVGEATLTYEEMATLLAEVEACLNSRPLQALSDDPGDLDALTPGHFLVGAPLRSLPEPSLAEVAPNRLTRWRLLQQMRDHLWQRWSAEYIQSLAPRPKWWTVADAVREGQLCLLKQEATSPTRWPLVRITRLHPGDDGRVRVVTVRAAAGELRRPVVKLVPLPMYDENDRPK